MKSQIAVLESQVEKLLQQIEDLKKQGPRDVHIASKAVDLFVREYGFVRELNESNLKILRKTAAQLGYTGKDSALRTAFLFRKYWVQMEDFDWR